MLAKLKIIYDAIILVASLYGKIKEAYKVWKIKRIEKAIQERKDHLRTSVSNIQHEASSQPSEESDEKIKEYYRQLYNINKPK